MKRWTDKNGIKFSEPDCADEWLYHLMAIGFGYDGCQTAEELEKLVKRLCDMADLARQCLWQGKLFGVYGDPNEEAEDPKTLRPQGRWHKLHETKLTKTVECTHCNWSARFKKEDGIIVDSFLYCPSCGAEMKGGTP